MDKETLAIITDWFNKLEDWQKDLFNNLWKGNGLDESKNRAFKLLQKEYGISESNFVPNVDIPNDLNFDSEINTVINLKEISEVQGVGALEPTNPIEFCDGLNVVYGENGCGKSSYVKILKKAENPKSSVKIYGNVYKGDNVNPRAVLKFEEDGAMKTTVWGINNKDTYPIKIYDSQIAKHFVEEANDIIYEPKVLSIFTLMAETYEKIANNINDEIKKYENKLEKYNKEIEGEGIIKEYINLKGIKQIEDFEEKIEFNDDKDKELRQIIKNTADENPQKTLSSLKQQMLFIQERKKQIVKYTEKYNEFYVKKHFKEMKNYNKIIDELKEYTESSKKISSLEGFGSNEWKKLWQSAKEYAVIANDDKTFPSTSNNKCLLCQQNISNDTKNNMDKFEEYYKSDIVKRYDSLKEYIDEQKKENEEILSTGLNIDLLEKNMTAYALDEEIKKEVIDIYERLYKRILFMYEEKYDDDMDIPTIYKLVDIETIFQKAVSEISTKIKSVEDFIKDYDGQMRRKRQLLAEKWLFDNKDNFKLKKLILRFEKIKSKCKTNSITTTKKNVSRIIITDTYIKRFKEELKYICPKGNINVELEASGKKGTISHQIVLKGAVEKRKTEDILSEGEYRVVSIAAFLADLNSWYKNQVFVFDDPITSLDHRYEDNVARRIVELSKERQVIVFTHRLTLAESLSNKIDGLNKEKKIDGKLPIDFSYIELKKNPLGNPIAFNDFGKVKLEKSLNNLLSYVIPKLRKASVELDYSQYELMLKGQCSQFRDLIEKGIETDLLSGVVSRYRQNIASLQIKKLKAIDNEDVDLFDKLMTKYSYFDHSYATEKPVELPEIDELENDVKELLDWAKKYKKKAEVFK